MEIDGEFEESVGSMVHCKRLYSSIPMKAPTAVPFDLEAYLREKSQLIDQALKVYLTGNLLFRIVERFRRCRQSR